MKALSIRNLTKQYSEGTWALKGIDLDVDEGDFFGLLGPNGAGKSTAIGIISTLINKSDGEIKIFGENLETNSSAAKLQLGLVPQEFNFNIFEKIINILVGQAGYYGIPYDIARERAEDLLKKLDLWSKANLSANTLSGGMKRRLMIARGLIHQPKLLILDEPTAGVDIELRRFMWEFLKELNEQGTTIILTTHYLEEAEHLCRNVAIIDHGEIIEHTSVKNLISQTNQETYILDLKTAIVDTPILEGFECILSGDSTLEVSFQRPLNLNILFEKLIEQGYEVLSLRNKVNRLEEFFLARVAQGQKK
tara:strand:+ start:75828 stop:76748 length:921 start_codon:yes stop_codon:yes gene_type:complete